MSDRTLDQFFKPKKKKEPVKEEQTPLEKPEKEEPFPEGIPDCIKIDAETPSIELVQCQVCGNKFEPENIWAKNPDVCKYCFIPGKEIRDEVEEVQDVEEPKEVHIPGDGFIDEPPLTEPEVEEPKQEEPTPEDLVQCQICGNKFEQENMRGTKPDVCKHCHIPESEIIDESPKEIRYMHLKYKVEVTYLDVETRLIKALVSIPYHGLEIGDTMVVDARTLNKKRTRF